MQKTTVKLVTIIAEAVLEDRLIQDIKQLGARGYTVVDVHGEGTRGLHATEDRNVRIETLVDPPIAEKIFEHLAAHYFAHYAVAAYAVDAEVIRGEKYRGY